MENSKTPESNINANLIRSAIKRGEGILKSKIRRTLGFFDNEIYNWLDECDNLIQVTNTDTQNIKEKIVSARRRLDSQSIKEIIDSLYHLLSSNSNIINYPTDYQSLTRLPLPNLRQIKIESRLCFVIMPFSHEYKPTFEKAIRPSVEDLNCAPIRADNVYEPGAITTQIFYYLAKSEFCIADISGLNANVMYELGIAHTLEKPTITITSDESERVPFDIASYRYISYRKTEYGLKELYTNLVKAISSLTR